MKEATFGNPLLTIQLMNNPTPALKAQLVSTFDRNPHLKMEEIADAFGLELDTVKLVLETNGSQRIAEAGSILYGTRKLFKQHVLNKVTETIENLVENEDPLIQFKACELVLKVETGSMAPKNVLNQFNQNITIQDLNKIIEQRVNSDKLARPILDVEAC